MAEADTTQWDNKPLSPGQQARAAFPIFKQYYEDKPLAFLDSAASSQKPACVIDRMTQYFMCEHANIHRGAYRLSGEATVSYDKARRAVADFLTVPAEEVIFTRGTTESINLVARCIEPLIPEGSRIVLTTLEHHSNIVPWQLLAERKNLQIDWVEITKDAAVDIDVFRETVNAAKPELVAFTALSNAFGSVLPVDDFAEIAKRAEAYVLVDAAQSVAHSVSNFTSAPIDFLAFSGHKLYGPTGIGALYARSELQEAMPPFHGGGDMIERVTTSGSTWAVPPQKFEAGTPPIAEAIGLGEAIKFVSAIGMQKIADHEDRLLQSAYEMLSNESGVSVYGPMTSGGRQSSILAFNVDGIHPHDLSTILDEENVQIRAGHHCAMPALKSLGLSATARASFAVYSVEEDIEQLLEGIRKAKRIFS